MPDNLPRTDRLPGAAETAALGIVFGDIGTSPLYALRQSVVAAGGTEAAGQAEVVGVLSLVFWTITVVVTLKYVLLVLRADHDGEGGVLALLTLLRPRRSDLTGRILILTGLVGAATLFGDGVLTPAISVLSAVEGLEVVAPSMARLDLPIAVAILAGLFMVQRFGTAPIARFFGPVMLTWFAAIGLFGAAEIVREPQVLAAVDPRNGLALLIAHPACSAPIMGAVFLAVTGGEALYADLGQFGRPVIQRAWFAVALPTLLLNYFGQGALLLHRPEAIENPFFALVPAPFGIPVLILATLATIIASQAVITGSFCLAKQATELGYIPPMRMRHTSPENEREIYIGRVNATLAACTIAIAIAFGSSASLASAYGIAVSITMVATTVLFVAEVRRSWTQAFPWLAALSAGLLAVDLALVGANLTKVADGGWLPPGFGAAVLLVMLSWRQGLDDLGAYQRRQAMSLETFAAETKGRLTHRTAIFLTRTENGTPSAPAGPCRHQVHDHGRGERGNLGPTAGAALRTGAPDQDRPQNHQNPPRLRLHAGCPTARRHHSGSAGGRDRRRRRDLHRRTPTDDPAGSCPQSQRRARPSCGLPGQERRARRRPLRPAARPYGHRRSERQDLRPDNARSLFATFGPPPDIASRSGMQPLISGHESEMKGGDGRL
jgi:KUP system potassium uptake protein